MSGVLIGRRTHRDTQRKEVHLKVEAEKKKSGSRWQEEWGGGIRREFEIEYTQLYLKWITSKDLPYSTGNSAQCYVAAWMGGGWRENGYMCIVWLRPFFVHLKLSEQCLLFFFFHPSVEFSQETTMLFHIQVFTENK